MSEVDLLAALRRESARFLAVLRAVEPATPVPSCPGWTASDLLWHLCEVQWFWATIVTDRLDDPGTAEDAKPDRPRTHADLAELMARSTARLHDALASADPFTPVWTWTDDRTVGFVRRRQAHEALIHRVDAELTADSLTPLDPPLASDGIDELLRVCHAAWPGWATFTPDASVIRIEAQDTGTAWHLTTGRWRGTSPNTGTTYDELGVSVVADETDRDVALRGDASTLDRWLWGRIPRDGLSVDGDQAALEVLDAVVAEGIE